MSDLNQKQSADQWTSTQAYILAVICLLVGIAGGWFIRGSQTPIATASSDAATSVPASPDVQQMPGADQMRQMADTQAAPLLAQLKSQPSNPGLLSSIGNIYYDTRQFPAAVEYYKRALQAKPSDTSVRTDLATAYWYMGQTDVAIQEFDKVLATEPNKANALFNLGIVKWQGKMDVNGAVAAWEKLLQTNPNYEGKEKVEQLIAQARKHSNIKPGTQAKSLPE